MAFTSNRPLIWQDKVYDLFGVSLIVSPYFAPDGSFIEARVVLNLDRYRINEDGKIEQPMKAALDHEGNPVFDANGQPGLEVAKRETSAQVLISEAFKASAADPALAIALAHISQGIQDFLNAKDI